MKIASLVDAVKNHNLSHGSHEHIEQVIIHTGQHYDEKMSKLFFDELEIPNPDINLEVGSGSHAVQTAEIMKRFEPVLLEEKPDYVLVVGDVNSTIACSLVAVKHGIRVAHVEAGLRSFDRSMPEEINRILTDAISDFLFVTEESGILNLRNEGIPVRKIHFVGNVMIDTLMKHRQKSEKHSKILERLGLVSNEKKTPHTIDPYGILTLHRPSNVDDRNTFMGILDAISEIARTLPIIFPIHPRTLKQLMVYNFQNYIRNYAGDEITSVGKNGIHCIEPLGYLDFLRLMSCSRLMFTDSGGIQEETTVLGVPCITMRKNTERPVTVCMGTNILAGTDKDSITDAARTHLVSQEECSSDNKKRTNIPELWDGKASERIVRILSSDRRY